MKVTHSMRQCQKSDFSIQVHGTNFLASCRTKFSDAWVRSIFAYVNEKTDDEYLSTKLQHCAQSSSVVMSPRWQKIMPVCASAGGLHRHRPAADSRGLRLWLPPCRFSHHNSQGLGNWTLKATFVPWCSMAETRIRQAVSFINIGLWITVYCKKGSQTKNSHSLQSEISQNKISKFQKMEKLATFLTLCSTWTRREETYARKTMRKLHTIL